MRWGRYVSNTWRIVKTVVGGTLALIGLGGVPDDLNTWNGWKNQVVSYLDQETARWLFVIGGVSIIALTWAPWAKWFPWKRDQDRTRDLRDSLDRWAKEARGSANDKSPRYQQVMTLWIAMNRTEILSHIDDNPIQHLNEMSLVFADRIGDLFGAELQSEYLDRLRKGAASKNVVIACSAAFPLVYERIHHELSEEEKSIARNEEERKCADDKLRIAKGRLQHLASLVPVQKTGGVYPAELRNPILMVNKVMYGEEPKDWKAETRAELATLLKSELCNEYEKCLRRKSPELSARAFLNGLRTSLKSSDLR